MSTTAEYEAFFDQVDADNSGSVNKQEMKEFLQARGKSEDEVNRFFDAADTSADGKITRREFLVTMGCGTDEEIKAAIWRRAFLGFDKDKSGKISKSELAAVFAEVGKQYPDEDLNTMMEMMDSSGDAEVDYEEFIQKFCS